jgi:hypothetical protein
MAVAQAAQALVLVLGPGVAVVVSVAQVVIGGIGWQEGVNGFY